MVLEVLHVVNSFPRRSCERNAAFSRKTKAVRAKLSRKGREGPSSTPPTNLARVRLGRSPVPTLLNAAEFAHLPPKNQNLSHPGRLLHLYMIFNRMLSQCSRLDRKAQTTGVSNRFSSRGALSYHELFSPKLRNDPKPRADVTPGPTGNQTRWARRFAPLALG